MQIFNDNSKEHEQQSSRQDHLKVEKLIKFFEPGNTRKGRNDNRDSQRYYAKYWYPGDDNHPCYCNCFHFTCQKYRL
jgi:hypothetical protein